MDWVYPIITIFSAEIKRIVDTILEQALPDYFCLSITLLFRISQDISMKYTTLERQSSSDLEQYLHLSTS